MRRYLNIDPKQDTTPTKVKVTFPCWIHGEPRKIDDEVVVGRQDAIDLQSMKRAVIVEE